MIIKMYDGPRRIKIKDLFADAPDKYYIQTFEYGDFDNWVTAVVYETSLTINTYSMNPKQVYNGKYSAYFTTTFVPIDKGKQTIEGGLINNTHKFVGCSGDIKVGNLEDIMNEEITITGEYTRG